MSKELNTLMEVLGNKVGYVYNGRLIYREDLPYNEDNINYDEKIIISTSFLANELQYELTIDFIAESLTKAIMIEAEVDVNEAEIVVSNVIYNSMSSDKDARTIDLELLIRESDGGEL